MVVVKEKLIEAHTAPEHKGHFEQLMPAANKLAPTAEKSPDTPSMEKKVSQAETIERARREVEQEAVSAKETLNGKKKDEKAPADAERTADVNFQRKDVEYKKTMTVLQSRLSAPSRTFSKVIHQPAFERFSELLGASAARPNAILTGSFTAFLAVFVVYLLAKQNGFQLSGTETIVAFIGGWAVGIAIDLLGAVIRQRT